MKKYVLLILFLCIGALSPLVANTATWTPTAPAGFSPITWVSAPGIASFMRAPQNAGYIDYITIINLGATQVKLVSSGISRTVTSPAVSPFPTTTAENWLFTRAMVENFKANNPGVKFIWDMPFFSITNPTTNLAFGVKSEDASGPYITSGYRLPDDVVQPRRMLIINNEAGTAKISDFNEMEFIVSGDQAVEGFDPFSGPSATGGQAARLYVGVRNGGKELVVYCSRSASGEEARNALVAAGVPVEHQMQGDGGGSATCGYNLPGQYFVEPGRALPHVMGAMPFVLRGTITIDQLNVRVGPAAVGTAIRQLPIGSPVTAYEEKNGWYRIGVGEWVLGKYVKKVVTYPYSGVVTINQLNVRSGAGTTFAPVRKLPLNASVSVLEEKNGWLRIGDKEWVSATYIK
jgi:uncharacterized protein YgiM (DUF1202 family)